MMSLLWLIPALPLAGYLALAFGGSRLSRAAAAWIGVGSVGLSALVALGVAAQFIGTPPAGPAFHQTLWTWMSVEDFKPAIGFYLDAMTVVFVLVVTGVGFLIHLYSVEYMAGDEGFRRFFAYMNLFVASMLVLVMADNLLLLYLGWEGVGLCSYLLIGFWYKDRVNGRAAQKAFIVTRVGDTAMALGLFLLVWQFRTLDVQQLMTQAREQWRVGAGMATAAAALLLGGALGKSAQLPLQTWLPDAMAGPTPVSALIHAATMVTAGVYLIARTHVLFELAPAAQLAVAIIGAATLLISGFSALAQRDIKRVLAYSTISQIGYMFLALGVGAWSAAVFHFMTHAFFKALLFLGAGAVILSLHHEQDIHKMGGLWKRLPLTFWTFLAGSAALAGLPLITAGFYSKDLILWSAWSSNAGGPALWAAGLIGAFLTALYTTRLVCLVFFGEEKGRVASKPGWRVSAPLAILAALSIVGGFVETPRALGGIRWFGEFLRSALPAAPGVEEAPERMESAMMLIASAAALLGIVLAGVLYLGMPRVVEGIAKRAWGAAAQAFWLGGWGFDWLYDRLFVKPFVWAATVNRDDFIDSAYNGVAAFFSLLHRGIIRTQTGRVRWYAAGVALGAVALMAIVLWVR
ncbi:MAG: NADH-quinone oxidoreductase subunit L [Candidatus Sumerlaeota bacterium]|nr:NADH-quinone oxidoreductase subunit L [Candidatus Sumerlaeota bacterium]